MANAISFQWVCLIISTLIVSLKSQTLVNVTLLPSAVAKGAVCLDGSPPAYYLQKGADGVNNWIIRMQGGGWCASNKECAERAETGYGSTKKVSSTFNFTGILSDWPNFNPYFYNWTKVFVKYCDGGSFSGNVDQVDQTNKTMPLYYRGERIFDAVMEDLLAKGIKNASNVMFYGNSAGGLAAMLHCDKFRNLLPRSTKVKCLSDGGYFIDATDVYNNSHKQQGYFRQLAELHGLETSLPEPCRSNMLKQGKPTFLCMYPQYFVQHIRTPLFVLNSAYDPFQIQTMLAPITKTLRSNEWNECRNEITNCTCDQVKAWKNFRQEFITALAGLNSSANGMFINSCHSHCQTLMQEKWLGDSVTLNNKSISDAVGEWFLDISPFQKIAYEETEPKKCVHDSGEPNPENGYEWKPPRKGAVIPRRSTPYQPCGAPQG